MTCSLSHGQVTQGQSITFEGEVFEFCCCLIIGINKCFEIDYNWGSAQLECFKISRTLYG